MYLEERRISEPPMLVIFVVCCLLIATTTIAQNPDSQGDSGFIMNRLVLEDQVERLTEINESETDYSELMEELADMAEKPVDLNKIHDGDLERLLVLTPGQRSILREYLVTYGEVLSLFELLTIPGFDSVLLTKLKPYVTISKGIGAPKFNLKNLAKFGHQSLLIRLEQSFPRSLGYLQTDTTDDILAAKNYPGSPQRYYFRYNYTWLDKISLGIAGEKDPGEQFFAGNQKYGMDYYAGYLAMTNIGILKNLIVGNFKAAFGQGLTLGSGLNYSSVPGLSGNSPLCYGVKPAMGMNEVSYFRGIAATIRINHGECSVFFSNHSRDATISQTDSVTLEPVEISSFTTSGYHRTLSELSKKNTVTEMILGGNFNYSMAVGQQFGFKIGITSFFSHYSLPVHPKIAPYSQFRFQGDHNFNTGIDLQVRYRGHYFFAECSRSLSGGYAYLAGANLKVDSRVGWTIVYRKYQPEYQNMFSGAFGQNSGNANETGLFGALNVGLSGKLTLSAYADVVRFPWLKYQTNAPSGGSEFGAEVCWQPSLKFALNLRYSQRGSQVDFSASDEPVKRALSDIQVRVMRLNLNWLPQSGLILRTRFESKQVADPKTATIFGYLAFQEVQIKGWRVLESIILRYSLFDIPGYSARIYICEPEVLYGYSVPAYQGRGMKGCLVLKLAAGPRIDLWLRGAITWYSDRTSLGSGQDMTYGNIRGEMTGQMMIKF